MEANALRSRKVAGRSNNSTTTKLWILLLISSLFCFTFIIIFHEKKSHKFVTEFASFHGSILEESKEEVKQNALTVKEEKIDIKKDEQKESTPDKSLHKIAEKIDIQKVEQNRDKYDAIRDDPLYKCIEHRGSSGYWYVNETFGKQTFYKGGFRSNKWWRRYRFTIPVYQDNKYDWIDTSMSSLRNETTDDEYDELSCQISAVNRALFCSTMEKLKISRIFAVGDSLTFGQMFSLMRLIGIDPPPPCEHGCTVKVNICDAYHPLEIIFRRENVGANFMFKTAKTMHRSEIHHFGPEGAYCTENPNPKDVMSYDEFCPWQLDYNTTTSGNTRTLLLLNQGAHFHSVTSFRNSFDHFVQAFNQIAHPRDIVVFRSSVPGHKDCWDEFEKGIDAIDMTHDKFLDRYGITKYDWNLFDVYNRYAKDAMATNLTTTVRSLYLNVYNMTVLRADAHVSSTDYLHYMHPGPVDFWNHMLFSNLVDLAKIEEKKARKNV